MIAIVMGGAWSWSPYTVAYCHLMKPFLKQEFMPNIPSWCVRFVWPRKEIANPIYGAPFVQITKRTAISNVLRLLPKRSREAWENRPYSDIYAWCLLIWSLFIFRLTDMSIFLQKPLIPQLNQFQPGTKVAKLAILSRVDNIVRNLYRSVLMPNTLIPLLKLVNHIDC